MTLAERLEVERGLERLKADLEEQRKREQEERKLIIERLDRSKVYTPGEGYRFYDGWIYAFYDVYWNRVSEHYLIQERYRLKQHNMKLGIKLLDGPNPVEILDPETSEETVNKRCLERLICVIKRNYKDVDIEISGNFDLLEIKMQKTQ